MMAERLRRIASNYPTTCILIYTRITISIPFTRPDRCVSMLRALRTIGRPIPLEQASGPFRPLFTSAWSALPMPGSLLLFWPDEPEGERWNDISHAIDGGWLHPALTEVSLLSDLRCPAETWSKAGLDGPILAGRQCPRHSCRLQSGR